MTGLLPFPAAPTPPMDSDDDADDEVIDTTGSPPDDIPNDDLTATEPPIAAGFVADTDVDEPVAGTPPRDDEISG